MGIKVVSGAPRLMVQPVSPNGTTGDTVYVGQLVYMANDGVLPKGAASGAADTTNKANIIAGVVTGICEVGSQVSYSSSYSANYISTPANIAQSHLAARSEAVMGHAQGMWKVGDTDYKVLIAVVTPDTILEAPIYNAAFGTAPTEVTVTSGSTTGLGCTTGAIDFTPVSKNATIQCTSGANRGVARLIDSTSTTIHTWDRPMKEDIAVGDKFIAVNLPYFGAAKMQLDSESMFIDTSAALTSDYYSIFVYRLYMDDKNNVKAEFSFLPVHWDAYRA